jgi:diaminopimelate epimerase
MQTLPFHKLSGAGNDFIVLDERDLDDEVDPGWLAARLCRRALSLGADGLILLGPERANAASVRVRFYNPLRGARRVGARLCGRRALSAADR